MYAATLRLLPVVLVFLAPMHASAAEKCFSRNLSLVGLSADGKFGAFVDIEQPSESGSAQIRDLTTQVRVFRGKSAGSSELDVPLEQLLPAEERTRYSLVSFDPESEGLPVTTAHGLARIELDGGARVVPLRLLPHDDVAEFELEGAHEVGDAVVLVFEFDDGGDCDDRFSGDFAMRVPKRSPIKSEADWRSWEKRARSGAPPKQVLEQIAGEIFRESGDPLSAALLVELVLKRKDVKRNAALYFSATSQRLHYLSLLGLAGRRVCEREGSAVLKRKELE